MQKVCPKCDALNPVANSFCGHCGAPLESAMMVQEVDISQPPAQPKKTKNDTSCFVALVFLILAGCALTVLVAVASLAGSQRKTKTYSAIDAWVITKQFVEDRLVSPATADFPPYSPDFTEHLGNGRYRVTSYVDSQNRMGGLVRTRFVAIVRWTGGDNWRLESLIFDEK